MAPRAAEASGTVLTGLPAGSGIVALRLRSLGDTLLTTPALAALKAWRPDLRLAVAVEPRFAPVLERNPDIQEIILVPPTLTGRLRAVRALRRFRPSLALGLHGGSTAAWLARTSGAPERATFAGLRHRWAYNLRIPPQHAPGTRLHTVEHAASLLTALGMPRPELGPLRIFPRPAALAGMRRRLEARGLAGPYLFFNTGAREPDMRWPPERFRELAVWLRERGMAAVMASPEAGAPIEGVILLSGTSVDELIAAIAGSAGVIGNDGGPIHIGAALGKPTLVLYSSTDVPVWSPWRTAARWLRAPDLATVTATQAEAALAELGMAPVSGARPASPGSGG